MEAVDNFNGPEQTHLFPVKWSSGMESNLTLKADPKLGLINLKPPPKTFRSYLYAETQSLDQR